MVSPSRVRGALSCSRSGLRDWLIQRISALVLALYLLVLLVFWWSHPGITFTQWHAFFTCSFIRVFTVLALLSVLLHAWIGLWVVCTDYIRCPKLRLMFHVAVILALFTYVVWGIDILVGGIQ